MSWLKRLFAPRPAWYGIDCRPECAEYVNAFVKRCIAEGIPAIAVVIQKARGRHQVALVFEKDTEQWVWVECRWKGAKKCRAPRNIDIIKAKPYPFYDYSCRPMGVMVPVCGYLEGHPPPLPDGVLAE